MKSNLHLLVAKTNTFHEKAGHALIQNEEQSPMATEHQQQNTVSQDAMMAHSVMPASNPAPGAKSLPEDMPADALLKVKVGQEPMASAPIQNNIDRTPSSPLTRETTHEAGAKAIARTVSAPVRTDYAEQFK